MYIKFKISAKNVYNITKCLNPVSEKFHKKEYEYEEDRTTFMVSERGSQTSTLVTMNHYKGDVCDISYENKSGVTYMHLGGDIHCKDSYIEYRGKRGGYQSWNAFGHFVKDEKYLLQIPNMKALEKIMEIKKHLVEFWPTGYLEGFYGEDLGYEENILEVPLGECISYSSSVPSVAPWKWTVYANLEWIQDNIGGVFEVEGEKYRIVEKKMPYNTWYYKKQLKSLYILERIKRNSNDPWPDLLLNFSGYGNRSFYNLPQ